MATSNVPQYGLKPLDPAGNWTKAWYIYLQSLSASTPAPAPAPAVAATDYIGVQVFT